MKEMIRKSLWFDGQFLRMKSLRFSERLVFIAKKYKALVAIGLGREGRIRFKNIDITCREFSSLGTVQSSMVDFYHDIVAPGIITTTTPHIVDIGANIGQFCNAAKLFFPKATVYSFEPDPQVFEELEANTESLNKVHLFNDGLSDKAQTLPFYVHPQSVMSSFSPYEGQEYAPDQIRQLKLKVFDAVFSAKQHIDLLKIDVEGFETQVLHGASKSLGRTDYLLLELSLGRATADNTNLALLGLVQQLAPQAKVVKFGRPLGNPKTPMCQDVLIAAGGTA